MKGRGLSSGRYEVMRTDVKAYLISSLLHFIAVGSAISFAVLLRSPQTQTLVDFTIEPGQGAAAETRELNNASPPLPRASHIRPKAHKQPLPAVPPPRETFESPVMPETEAAVLSNAPEATPVAVAASPAQTADTALYAGMGTGPPGTSGNGGRGIIGNSGNGNGLAGESAEVLRARYLKEHFAYIRDLIARNLRYPGLARHMGWSGKLAVEFVVRVSGAVDSIRVARSSGIPILDSDAEDTVRRSAPFPKPPISARLIIPVEYVLEN